MVDVRGSDGNMGRAKIEIWRHTKVRKLGYESKIKELLCFAARRITYVFIAVALLSGCSEISISSLLEGEEDGPFSLNTNEVRLQVGQEYTIVAQGGYKPYSFTLDSDFGKLDSSTGRYTAPADLPIGETEKVKITATDYVGSTLSAEITVEDELTINPNEATIETEETTTFTVSGGFGDYGFLVEYGTAEWTGPASEGSRELEYTAPAEVPDGGESGTDTVTIFSGEGDSVTADVTVEAQDELTITPSTEAVFLETGGDSQTVDFEIHGGTGDYTTVEHDYGESGDIEWENGAAEFTYTVYPSSSEGTATITVTDSDDATAQATVEVVEEEPEELTIEPSSVLLPAEPGESQEFTVTGGVPDYRIRIVPGGGNYFEFDVDGNTATFLFTDTPPPGHSNGTWNITVTDADNETVTATIEEDTMD